IEHRVKYWNETIELFREGMPLRRHRSLFKNYECCFKASEAVDWLHELLRCNQNFGPEVTRNQTIQLLKKFLKNHVIEDIKGRWGKEDFEDDSHLYRFPPSSPLKPYPTRPPYRKEVIKIPDWNVPEAGTSQEHIPVKPVMMNSEIWFKRHSIAIGEVPACRLVHRQELTQANIEEIWKSMTLSHLQKVLGLNSVEEVLDTKLVNPKHIVHNVYNVNKQGIVILEDKTKELPHWVLSAMKCLANWPSCSDLKQPTYIGFERDVFKTIADYYGQMKEPLLTFHLFDVFVSVLGKLACNIINRRIVNNFMTLPPHSFSHCILCSRDEVDLDELLAAKLVTFLMDNCQEILNVPSSLQTLIEEHVVHLRRVQFQKSYPEVYKERFPTPESEAVLFPEKNKQKPQLLMWALKKPFQPFQRTRSFRM
uniref:DEP domain containing 1B n=1 Tax=Gopherus evgoodei TaxID=1825980 RepID=A0A8C4VWY7_9SAUR